MIVTNQNIDNGRPFDWGRTSDNYARFRDVYPQEFYDRIIGRNLCMNGQKVLDVGTGTGVLPRNLYRYGAKWVGTDISGEQIRQARILSEQMDIEYHTVSTEKLEFPNNSFDVITACQCFFYFDHEKSAPLFSRILKPDGKLLLLCMAWLPFEDQIAGESEKLVLKYNPAWSGAGETMHPIIIPEIYEKGFELVYQEEYPVKVHFTRESWHGRIKTCRGIGASLTEEEISAWEQEHQELLARIAPEEFDIQHYAALAQLRVIKQES